MPRTRTSRQAPRSSASGTLRRSLVLLAFAGVLFVGCGSPASGPDVVSLTTVAEWEKHTSEQSGVQVRASQTVGGRFDVIGEGALLLERPSGVGTTKPFLSTERFASTGKWISDWLDVSGSLDVLTTDVRVYGQPLDMANGWTKFSGNPLVTGKGAPYATEETLQLPDTLLPHDQALVRGTGAYEGQWLLLFAVNDWETGGWEAWATVGGWAAAVADSLAPLKRGENPFRLIDPYPLYPNRAAGDSLGYHAPNDFIHVDGTWYAPDESLGQPSHLWTSPNLTDWTNTGPIQGIQGHDPGLAYDGERFYLFTEDGTGLQYLSAVDPLGPWTAHGLALEVGDHTGDADLSFFNNAWHLFFDDAPHKVYTIGHAHTTPSAFPEGWQLTNDVFGPRMPDQGQTWDEPIPLGYNWGTGDPDLAIEGTTLYMTHERPTGIAYKELDLTDDAEQTVRLWLEMDTDGDGSADEVREQVLPAGTARLELGGIPAEQVRLSLRLNSRNPEESPMIRSLRLRTTAPVAASN